MKRVTAVLCLAAAALAAAFGVRVAARAQASTTTAFLGGLTNDKAAVPEIFVFNTTGASLTLDVVLRGPDGTTLVTHAGALSVAPFATSVLNLATELAKAGPNAKPYRGVFSAAVSGDASTFSDQTCIVHATQYFGTLKSPRAAFVVRPLFNSTP
jgi:hypothetical protein